MRGHDIDDVNHAWWFTVGGGLDVGEDARQAACREMREETGLVVTPERLEGVVLRRQALFHFVRETRRQYEDFFLVRLSDDEAQVVGNKHSFTAGEERVIDDMRWWSFEDLDELARREAVYPLVLPSRVHDWYEGWDGMCDVVVES